MGSPFGGQRDLGRPVLAALTTTTVVAALGVALAFAGLEGPAVLAAALVIFVLSVSEFGVPGLLRVRVYTTEVFTAFAALYDFSRAMLLAVPLLVLCLIVAIVAVALAGERLVSTRRGSGTRPPLLVGWRRPSRHSSSPQAA